MQHLLNNHMVGKRGWKRTDDVADIERRTKRRCLRRRRNTKSRIRKNVQGKIANQLPAAAHRVEGKLSKPVVGPNIPTDQWCLSIGVSCVRGMRESRAA